MEIVKFKPNEIFISIGFVTDYGVYKNNTQENAFLFNNWCCEYSINFSALYFVVCFICPRSVSCM